MPVLANVVRVTDADGVLVRDLPQMTGAAKEGVQAPLALLQVGASSAGGETTAEHRISFPMEAVSPQAPGRSGKANPCGIWSQWLGGGNERPAPAGRGAGSDDGAHSPEWATLQ